MRLFRLTSRQQTTALFDSSFNDQIVINPNSQISLQSVSLKVIPNEVIIEGDNNRIDFSINDGVVDRSCFLTPQQSYNTNFEALFLDMMKSLNGVCDGRRASDGSNKIIGIEWNVKLDSDSKVLVGYKLGKNGNYKSLWKPTSLMSLTGSVAGDIVFKTNGIASDLTNQSNAILPQSISRGNGYIRGRIRDLVYNSSENHLNNGLIIGLTKNSDLNQDSFLDSDITFGIFITFKGGVGADQDDPVFYTIQDGVFTINNSVAPVVSIAGNDPNNSIMECKINGSNLELNIYNNNSDTANQLLSVPYIFPQKLAPIIITRGGENDASINKIRLTPSPYDNENYIKDYQLTSEDLIDDTAPPINRGGGVGDENFLFFSSINLAQYLGYNNQRQPISSFTLGRTADFQADNKIADPENADSLVVQLLNLNVESYDSFSDSILPSGGQRRNIIGVVPSSSKTGSIVYEPNERFFLDLNNTEKIRLRNIKLRVVSKDYSDVPMIGLGSVVLLIKDKDE